MKKITLLLTALLSISLYSATSSQAGSAVNLDENIACMGCEGDVNSPNCQSFELAMSCAEINPGLKQVTVKETQTWTTGQGIFVQFHAKETTTYYSIIENERGRVMRSVQSQVLEMKL